jgi:hypothetical protein
MSARGGAAPGAGHSGTAGSSTRQDLSAEAVTRASSRGKGARTLRLLASAREILAEIQPATVRAVCYRLFVAGLILNMGKSCTNSVSRFLARAREEDEIPWQWIVDESREAETANRWNNPDEIIASAVRGYRRDYWQDQDCRVEVWSEKGTVRGTLGRVLNQYGIAFRVMHGYASATVVNDIAEFSNDGDKPLIALYVGDWDPSGKHMSDVDLPRRLEMYGAKLQLIRIALTGADLRRLPSFDPDTKVKDPRYRWFRRHVRTRCYELDAMPPPLLRARVEHEIRSRIDIPRWDSACRIERVEVESMQIFHRAWLTAQGTR